MGSLGLKNIHMSFGNNQVLTDINLEVDDGEFVIFVGPSGCGKSTLLRIIAGLETPVSGDVEISGQLVNAMPASRRKIAMVFQT
ncbi:MAG: ATP-binding cassette domain-containing protein, partial [Candidatus Puniceispirillaceae bacterium]